MTSEVTSLAGKTLADESATPEARRLASAVLNQAREDQADEAIDADESEDDFGHGDSEGEIPDSPSNENAGAIGSGSTGLGEGGSHAHVEPALRAELETERTNLQRKHSKMLDEPGYTRTLLAVQARLAEIDKEIGE